MSGKSQLRAVDVERGLKAAGFIEQARTSTSHVKWVRITNSGHFVVTVDANNEPFSDIMIGYMSKQAGMTKAQFYEICSKDGQKKAKRGALGWLSNIFDKPA